MLMSMRKSILKSSGLARPGRSLKSLYEVPRWDGAGTSRARRGHNCHKDKKGYRSWQVADAISHRKNYDAIVEVKVPLKILIPGRGWVSSDSIR